MFTTFIVCLKNVNCLVIIRKRFTIENEMAIRIVILFIMKLVDLLTISNNVPNLRKEQPLIVDYNRSV